MKTTYKCKYKIEIEYSTGNSFHNEETSDIIELYWNNLDIAKANLNRIKEHYNMYNEVDSYLSNKSYIEILEENKHKDWFVYEPKLYCISKDTVIDEKDKHKYEPSDIKYIADINFALNCIKLYNDDGKVFQMRCFWTGYFEHMHNAKIILEDSEIEITF